MTWKGLLEMNESITLSIDVNELKKYFGRNWGFRIPDILENENFIFPSRHVKEIDDIMEKYDLQNCEKRNELIWAIHNIKVNEKRGEITLYKQWYETIGENKNDQINQSGELLSKKEFYQSVKPEWDSDKLKKITVEVNGKKMVVNAQGVLKKSVNRFFDMLFQDLYFELDQAGLNPLDETPENENELIRLSKQKPLKELGSYREIRDHLIVTLYAYLTEQIGVERATTIRFIAHALIWCNIEIGKKKTQTNLNALDKNGNVPREAYDVVYRLIKEALPRK
ncbi:MAG: hypothetical protein JXQ90_21735 [Cyclobacteriaceae bacterium]